MANRPATVQMAVTSENQDFKGNMIRDDIDIRAGSNSPKTIVDGVPKKKTFKITSVKQLNQNDTADADSMDDLDESHTEMTEDFSSEILDMSRNTDYGQETPSAVEEIPLNNPGARDGKEKTDMHSRFRVVKIETKEPFKRGRWLCHDFLDPLNVNTVNAEKSETKVNEEVNSGSSSAGSSIHYVHGVDDPAKNPLLAGATGTIHMHIPEGQATGQDVSFQPIHPAPNTAVKPQTQVTVGYNVSEGQTLGLKNTPLCQSQSYQSISSIASTDNGPNVKFNVTIPTSDVVLPQGNTHSIDNNNPGMYMPHYSSGPGAPHEGSTISMKNVYHATSNSSTSQMPSDNTQPIMNIPGQGQTSTYQTYVHLGQQIPNPGISQSGHSETMPTNEINANIVQPATSEGEPSRDLPVSEFSSGGVDSNAAGGEDKDAINVIQDPDALSPALAAAVGDLSPAEEDKSGSSTVAIDNKIEQAMDLVKSHLMFAVREEVEVLKEQIAELIERNNQLEYENGVLRAAASAETLAKLAAPRQPPPPSSSS